MIRPGWMRLLAWFLLAWGASYWLVVASDGALLRRTATMDSLFLVVVAADFALAVALWNVALNVFAAFESVAPTLPPDRGEAVEATRAAIASSTTRISDAGIAGVLLGLAFTVVVALETVDSTAVPWPAVVRAAGPFEIAEACRVGLLLTGFRLLYVQFRGMPTLAELHRLVVAEAGRPRAPVAPTPPAQISSGAAAPGGPSKPSAMPSVEAAPVVSAPNEGDGE